MNNIVLGPTWGSGFNNQEFFDLLIPYVTSLANDLIKVAEYVASAFASVGSYLSVFPLAVSSILLIGFGVAIVYKVGGRE